MCSLLKSEILSLAIAKKLLEEMISAVKPAGRILGFSVVHKSNLLFKDCLKARS